MREPADKRDQSWLWMYIKCGVGKLSTVLEGHTTLRHPAFLHIGDLYRYSFVSCGKSEEDIACAQNSYRRAAELQPENGRAYNQLALTHQEKGEVLRAAYFYLRAASLPYPYPRAINNLAHLKVPGNSSGDEDTLVLIKQICVDFDRPTWDTVSRHYGDAMKESLSADNCSLDSVRALIEQTTCISLAVSFAIYSLGVQDDRLRLYTSMIFQSWTSLLEAVSSPSMEQSSTALSVLNGIAELLSHSSITCHFTQSPTTRRRVAVSLKLQYNSLVQNFIAALNKCAFTSLVEEDDKMINWYMHGPLFSMIREPLPRLKKILTCLLSKLNRSIESPVTWEEGRFNMRNGSCNVVNNSVIELTKELSPKLKISDESRTSPGTFQMPVYAVPTHEVLLGNLRQLNSVNAIPKLTTLIMPSVISQLDRMKRESTQAREAIRWLETAITASKVKVVHPTAGISGNVNSGTNANSNTNESITAHSRTLPCSATSTLIHPQLIEELCSFLREKNLLQRQTLFATFLIASKGSHSTSPSPCNSLSQYPVLSVSTIDELLRGAANHHQEG